MFKKYIKQFKSESGVTLVELLAAITILSLFVTAFLAYFTQAANTNSITNEVNEATFIAQEEMERVTHQATLENLTVGEVEKDHEDGYKVTTKISSDSDSNLQKVIVTVTEGGDKLRAKMETRLPYAESPPSE